MSHEQPISEKNELLPRLLMFVYKTLKKTHLVHSDSRDARLCSPHRKPHVAQPEVRSGLVCLSTTKAPTGIARQCRHERESAGMPERASLDPHECLFKVAHLRKLQTSQNAAAFHKFQAVLRFPTRGQESQTRMDGRRACTSKEKADLGLITG